LAVEHIRPMKGGAQAHLLRAADGFFYVVKFVNNPQDRRVLANELLAARLAEKLELPVPPVAIVDVPARLIDASPGLVMRLAGQVLRCAPGLQFGSRLPARPDMPMFDYLPEPVLDEVANLSDFWGMLVFDKWTCNCNGRQVVFCRAGTQRALRAFMIDQGFCFNAGEWSFPDSPLRGIYSRTAVYRGVTGWEAFAPWMSKVEAYEPEAIQAAAEEIPPVWYEGDIEALERLLGQLIARRTRMRELLMAVKNSPRVPFENWKGSDK
jgi:hypothetical protein